MKLRKTGLEQIEKSATMRAVLSPLTVAGLREQIPNGFKQDCPKQTHTHTHTCTYLQTELTYSIRVSQD